MGETIINFTPPLNLADTARISCVLYEQTAGRLRMNGFTHLGVKQGRMRDKYMLNPGSGTMYFNEGTIFTEEHFGTVLDDGKPLSSTDSDTVLEEMKKMSKRFLKNVTRWNKMKDNA